MVSEQQLSEWMKELNGLYEEADEAFASPGVSLDAFRQVAAAYNARLTEINGQLSHLVFVDSGEREASIVLRLKKEEE